jgi:hypothetical protein
MRDMEINHGMPARLHWRHGQQRIDAFPGHDVDFPCSKDLKGSPSRTKNDEGE